MFFSWTVTVGLNGSSMEHRTGHERPRRGHPKTPRLLRVGSRRLLGPRLKRVEVEEINSLSLLQEFLLFSPKTQVIDYKSSDW